jgi:hypothetical protein
MPHTVQTIRPHSDRIPAAMAAYMRHSHGGNISALRLPTRIINKPVEANGLADMGWL